MAEPPVSAAAACRLCLCLSSQCNNIFSSDMLQQDVPQKILKYLYLEVKVDDPFQKTICSRCMDRLNNFHVFCSHVEANQEVLQFSQPTADQMEQPQPLEIIRSTQAEFIELSDYSIKTENYIVTLSQNVLAQQQQPLNDGTAILERVTFLDDNATICVVDEQTLQPIVAHIDIALKDSNEVVKVEADNVLPHKQATKTTKSNQAKVGKTRSVKLSKKRNVKTRSKCEDKEDTATPMDDANCTSNSSAANVKEIVDFIDNIDDVFDDDEADEVTECDQSVIYESHEQFAGFPKVIIKNSRLHIRGGALLDLMSRFFRLECDLCPENQKSSRSNYKDLSVLCQHFNAAHSMKGYVVCCGVKLIKPRAMALHMARHLQPEAFKCTICEKMMTCPKILQYHMQNHLPEEQRPLACRECPRKFSYSSALLSHAISHKPESEREAHICDECGKSFSSPGRLSTHTNASHISHSNDFICHICAKQFTSRSNLTYHLTTHQPRIHQVQCEQCGKWLKNKLCLRKHMVQHSEQRFSCDLCDYTCLNRQCMRNHKKVQHSDVKPFSCQQCGNTFKLRNTLMNHLVQHTGVRRYECEFCFRLFASSGNYYSHRKRMHPQELAAAKAKKEDEERQLRAKVFKDQGNNDAASIA